MKTESEPALLARAAAQTLERLRRDRSRARRARPYLAVLERQLFDPGLTVSAMATKLGERPGPAGMRFKAEMVVSFRRYLAERRFEVARRLLSGSDLRVCQIARLVGYDYRVFSNAFCRRFGTSPGAYRHEMRAAGAPRLVAEEPISLELVVRGLADALEPEEEERLLARLGGLCPDAAAEGREPLFDGRQVEEALAETVWRAIEKRPYDEQLAALGQAGFTTPALFDLLREKSRELGRRDRRLGVELAELAVASLETTDEVLGRALPGLRALGWAWVGNARRLAEDFPGAEQAFELAEAAWVEPETPRDPLLDGQILDMKASLRLFQRRHREALELVGRAISDFERAGDARLLAKTLILRASIRYYLGKHKAGVSDLRRALDGLDPRQGRLRLAAFQALAIIQALTGEAEQAARSLRRARELCASQDDAVLRLQLTWVDGLVRRARGQVTAAERCFCHAQAGFSALEEVGYAAVASLDLAVLCAEQGRTAKAMVLAAETVPAFEALRIHREAAAALKLLRPALAAGELPLAVLWRVREHLERLRRDPAVRFRSEA